MVLQDLCEEKERSEYTLHIIIHFLFLNIMFYQINILFYFYYFFIHFLEYIKCVSALMSKNDCGPKPKFLLISIMSTSLGELKEGRFIKCFFHYKDLWWSRVPPGFSLNIPWNWSILICQNFKTNWLMNTLYFFFFQVT